MRALVQIGAFTVLALLGTVACDGTGGESTITETDFLQQFEEIYCGQWDICGNEDTCPDVSSVLSTSCLYDSAFAQDCLAGDFACDDAIGVLIPTTCAGVYDCDATGDDDDDDNGTNTSYPTPTGEGEPTI